MRRQTTAFVIGPLGWIEAIFHGTLVRFQISVQIMACACKKVYVWTAKHCVLTYCTRGSLFKQPSPTLQICKVDKKVPECDGGDFVVSVSLLPVMLARFFAPFRLLVSWGCP